MSRKLFLHFLIINEVTVKVDLNWVFPILKFAFTTRYIFPIFVGHVLAELPLSEFGLVSCLARIYQSLAVVPMLHTYLIYLETISNSFLGEDKTYLALNLYLAFIAFITSESVMFWVKYNSRMRLF